MSYDWEEQPLRYALIRDGRYKIVDVDDVLDDSALVCIGSYSQCEKTLTELYAAACDRAVEAHEKEEADIFGV